MNCEDEVNTQKLLDLLKEYYQSVEKFTEYSSQSCNVCQIGNYTAESFKTEDYKLPTTNNKNKTIDKLIEE